MTLRVLVLVGFGTLTVVALTAFAIPSMRNASPHVAGPDPDAAPIHSTTPELPPTPATPATPAEAYARALVARDADEWNAAASLFALVSEGGPPLSGMAHLRRA